MRLWSWWNQFPCLIYKWKPDFHHPEFIITEGKSKVLTNTRVHDNINYSSQNFPHVFQCCHCLYWLQSQAILLETSGREANSYEHLLQSHNFSALNFPSSSISFWLYSCLPDLTKGNKALVLHHCSPFFSFFKIFLSSSQPIAASYPKASLPWGQATFAWKMKGLSAYSV